jgi:ABC-type transport system involved in cytochrome c biogenesis permease component
MAVDLTARGLFLIAATIYNLRRKSLKKLQAVFLNTPAKSVIAVGLTILLGEFSIMVMIEGVLAPLLKGDVRKFSGSLLILLYLPRLFPLPCMCWSSGLCTTCNSPNCASTNN